MEKTHKYIQSIVNAMKTLHKGKISFVDKGDNWSVNVEVEWNKRITKTTIKSKKVDLKSDFASCKLSKSNFLTNLSYIFSSYIISHRSEAYSFSGTKSEYSEAILMSKATIPLMESKNPVIGLEGKYLIFSGGTRKKDISSLSNIFKLNEVLMKEIDKNKLNK
ncbi:MULTISPECIES: hypothetical protein [Aequorivita]|uniref:Uncharacterized protein n=1 Tax=Aequorivita iocasae TaxID=2803865 RepID=A0ABX7DTA4_9FLAO|nr:MULTISPECIES: hypothetical protein [Aequorivita]QQX77037.1 hypothetical protein JK629_01810 [Aequorivita iocasae]UCA56516.1 hypothetical protein LDL78_01825 [Aequorivita sp. F7]